MARNRFTVDELLEQLRQNAARCSLIHMRKKTPRFQNSISKIFANLRKFVSMLLSFFSLKSIRFRGLICGYPTVIIRDGKVLVQPYGVVAAGGEVLRHDMPVVDDQHRPGHGPAGAGL